MKTGALFLFFLVPCVEAELCYNGGTFDGSKCICDEDLYYGPKCEFLVQDTLNGTVTTSITTSAVSGEIRTSPTHPTDTRATPHPTIPISTTSTAFTITTSQLCYNGGTFDGSKCICDEDLYYGPKCEFLVQDTLNGTVTTSITTRAVSGEIRTSPTHPTDTRATPHPTIPISTTSTAFTITTSQLCYNGGTFDGIKCICDEDLYYGPKCEFLVQDTLNGTVTTSITTSAVSGEIRTSPTHPTDTRATPHPTIPISTTSTAFTITTSQICQNGGIFDGITCRCNEDFFYGPKCEFLVDEIPVDELSVTITVEAQVKVTNRDFKKSLEDLNSSYSREIHTQFKKQMKGIYGGVPGYRDVEILRMRNGSIIVEHKIISQVLIWNNEEIIHHIMENITEAVIRALKNIHTEGECIDPSGPELCFVPLPNSIVIPSFSLSDTCKNISGLKYADYYYPHITNGTVRCVSRCFSGTQHSINCFNGVCRLSETGPHCICNNLDMFWYLDSYCQFPIQTTVLGLSLALIVFFVISIILVICLIKAKRKKSRKRCSNNADCNKRGQRNPVFPE